MKCSGKEERVGWRGLNVNNRIHGLFTEAFIRKLYSERLQTFHGSAFIVSMKITDKKSRKDKRKVQTERTPSPWLALWSGMIPFGSPDTS